MVMSADPPPSHRSGRSGPGAARGLRRHGPWGFQAVVRVLRCAGRFAAAALLLAAALAGAQAGTGVPASPLVLGDAHPEVDPWSALTYWIDPAAAPADERMLRNRGDFARPTQPRYSFGTVQGVLWLRFPLRLEATAGDRPWWLRVGYTELDRIDLLLVQDGRVVDQQVTGHGLPCDERPLCASAHVLPLKLVPGQHYEAWLRVQAAAEQVVPLAVLRADRLEAAERRSHLLGGLELGFALAVLLFALAHWVTMREPLFGRMALLAAATGGSLLCYSGVGERVLWPHSVWMMREGTLMFGLAGLAMTCLTLDLLLEAPRMHRLGSRLLRAGAALSVAVALLRLGGLIEFRTVNLVLPVLVLVPLVVGVVLAWLRLRAGDTQARLVLVERLLQGGGTVLFVGLLLGWLPANFWTQQSFATTLMASFVLYCTIIVRRVEAVREAALVAQRRQEQLAEQAQLDALTRLPNRRSLQALLEQALAGCSAQHPLALYLIDLDGFKPVNDRHGHAVGDALLVAFARRLGGLLRAGDVVARMGGDEFVVLAPVTDADAAQRLGRSLLGSCAQPFALGTLQCRVGLTAGWVLATDAAAEPAGLLAQADAALYAGKQQGRGCLVQAGAAGLAVDPMALQERLGEPPGERSVERPEERPGERPGERASGTRQGPQVPA
jgi:diguanylate cyclase (GGDEF)-like protein